MKIRLIEPKPPGVNVYDRSRLPRLGLPLLGEILHRAGHDVTIYVETIAPVDWYDVSQADLVGFSTTTSTAPAAYKMAARMKEIGVPTVIGGSHVTFLTDEALAHCDFVVRGEGQTTLPELVEAIEKGGTFKSIEGLSYRDADGRICHNAGRPPCTQEEFAALPAPNLHLIAGHERMTQMPYMTSWGCPYGCDFCSVIHMFGRQMRYRPVETILDDLESFRSGSTVFFYDDNFVVNKTRTKELLRGIIRRKLNFQWTTQMRASAVFKDGKTGELDRELLGLMKASGCVAVYCGFESVNQATLDAYNKHQNVSEVENAIRAFHAYEIHVHGMFVFGADTDTADTFDETATFALRNRIDTVQFVVLTPMPGTPLAKRLKETDRILSKDWSLYDAHYCVFQPKNMSAYECQWRTHRAMMKFYAPEHSIRILALTLPKLLLREQRVLYEQAKAFLLSGNLLETMIGFSQDSLRQLKNTLALPTLRLYALRQLQKWAEEAPKKTPWDQPLPAMR
ncbi:B12-binding domain-containing radical SAM protein [Candidatus Peregrinibacteria bacterium]|nr:B12-binding domain-containing radical SAM protein [Candidatus Peregrinibacteria bacterium]